MRKLQRITKNNKQKQNKLYMLEVGKENGKGTSSCKEKEKVNDCAPNTCKKKNIWWCIRVVVMLDKSKQHET